MQIFHDLYNAAKNQVPEGVGFLEAATLISALSIHYGAENIHRLQSDLTVMARESAMDYQGSVDEDLERRYQNLFNYPKYRLGFSADWLKNIRETLFIMDRTQQAIENRLWSGYQFVSWDDLSPEDLARYRRVTANFFKWAEQWLQTQEAKNGYSAI